MAKKKQTLEDRLTTKQETAWQGVTRAQEKKIYDFAEDYKAFLSESKTERESVEFIVAAAKKKGFKNLSDYKKLKAGDKVIFTNMGKTAALVVIGTDP